MITETQIDSLFGSLSTSELAWFSHNPIRRNESGYVSEPSLSYQRLPFEDFSVETIRKKVQTIGGGVELFAPLFSPEEPIRFSFIDLFAGIGGFRLGMQKVGGECLFSSEWDKYAQKTYFANYGEVPFGDICEERVKSFIPEEFDVLSAGFPCQPFSISGRMKGFEDTRGTLIYEVFKILERHKPKVVLLENVKQLVYHDSGKTLSVILKNLQELGYTCTWKVLNASSFGVPQNRERIIIVGCNTGVSFDFDRVRVSEIKPKLKHFLDDDADFQLLEEPYSLIDHPTVQKSGLVFVGYRNKTIRKNGVRKGTENLSRVHKQPNRIYSSEGVHPALPSQETSGRFWIKDGDVVRKLTIDECYRIMGFPEGFRRIGPMSEQYRQIGNSVCVPMVTEVSREIVRQLL